MNGTKALAIAIAAVAVSLTSSPQALAWPTCSHPAGTGDSTTHSETAAHRAIREHLILRRDYAAGRWESREDAHGSDPRSADDSDTATPIREGLLLPEQPRWQM